MVVGGAELVFAFLVSHDFQCAVGNYFVRIHVDGGSCTALHHVDGELVVEFTVNDFLASLANGICDRGIKSTEFGVRRGGRPLDVCHRNDVFRIITHVSIGNLVVVNGPLCLNAIVSIGGHFKFANQV